MRYSKLINLSTLITSLAAQGTVDSAPAGSTPDASAATLGDINQDTFFGGFHHGGFGDVYGKGGQASYGEVIKTETQFITQTQLISGQNSIITQTILVTQTQAAPEQTVTETESGVPATVMVTQTAPQDTVPIPPPATATPTPDMSVPIPPPATSTPTPDMPAPGKNGTAPGNTTAAPLVPTPVQNGTVPGNSSVASVPPKFTGAAAQASLNYGLTAAGVLAFAALVI